MELESELATAPVDQSVHWRLAERFDITGPPTPSLVELGFGSISQLVDNTDVLDRFAIADLEFDTRTYNCLTALGVRNIRQVLSLTEDALCALPGFGNASRYRLRETLNRFLASDQLSAVVRENSGRSSDSSRCGKSPAFSQNDLPPASSLAQTKNAFGWTVPSSPQDARSAPITSLGLSVRARHVLEQMNLRTVEDVLCTPQDAVYSSRSCGIKTLFEIQSRILAFLVTATDASPGLQDQSGEAPSDDSTREDLVINRKGWQLPPNITADLNTSLDHIVVSPRARGVLQQYEAKTINDMLRLDKAGMLRMRNCGRRTIRELQDRLSEFLSGTLHEYFGILSELGNSGTEFGLRAFVERMLALVDERPRRVVADRYGLWDGICETLQEIGDKLGCTRERVRQIEQKALEQLRHAVPTTVEALLLPKVFRWMSLSAHSVHVIGADEFARALADDCSEEEADLGLRFLDDCVGFFLAARQSLWEAEEGVYARNEEEAQWYFDLVVRIRELLESCGTSIPIATVRNSLESDGRWAAVDVDRVMHVSPQFTCLRNDMVALSRWPAYKRHTIGGLCVEALNKIGRPAHFSEIAKIVETLDPAGREVNERTVHQELVRNRETFVYVKRGTYGLAMGAQPCTILEKQTN
jgi:DNA-directed RNA polymerase alpha subunit